MKKLLKFMSLLLIVPMLGIGSLLTGCGKDEASLQDVKDTYNKMIKTYHKEANDASKLSSSENVIFSYNGDVEVTTENTYNYFKNEGSNISFNIDLEYLDLDNSDGSINNANGDLRKRYSQIEQIYSKLLKYSNLYFERYQHEFFEVAGNEELLDKEELYKLREKINNLEDKLEAFYADWKDKEEIAEFLGTNTEIMQTHINTFNSVYADLIEANFEFVLKFCDIHKTYLLNADKIAGGNTENHPLIAERTAYEAELKYAYGYFLYFVKAFQHNGLCNTFELFKNAEAGDKEDQYYTYVVYTNIKTVIDGSKKLEKAKKKGLFNSISFKNETEYLALSDAEKEGWRKLEFHSYTIKQEDKWLWHIDDTREIIDHPSEYALDFLQNKESIQEDDSGNKSDKVHAFNEDKYNDFLNNYLTDTVKRNEFVEKCLKVTITAAQYGELTEYEKNYYSSAQIDIIPNEIFNKFIDENGNAKVFTTAEGKLIDGVQLDLEYTTQLKQHIARFDSFTNLLNTNMSNFDIYTYTLVRIGSSEALYSADEYEKILSDSELAQKTMLDEYEAYDLPLLAGAIKLSLGLN